MSAHKESFSDQCRVVCLNYLIESTKTESNIDEEVTSSLCRSMQSEVGAFDFETKYYFAAAQSLAKLSLRFEKSIVVKIMDSAKELDAEDLTQQTYEDIAEKLLEGLPVQSWYQVALLLHLVYGTYRLQGIAKLDRVVDAGVRCLRKYTKEFVESQNGWSVVAPLQPEGAEGILSSVVIVPQQQGIRDQQAGVPPTDSPPFSLLSPITDETELESLDSATPPEMVDRPPMTASLIQMMGGGDAPSTATSNGNTGASSECTDFELVESSNNSTPGSPKQPMGEEVEAVTPTPSSVSPVKPLAPSSPPSQVDEPPQDDASVTDYIPHISLGVAAAAACIGFYILKKAT